MQPVVDVKKLSEGECHELLRKINVYLQHTEDFYIMGELRSSTYNNVTDCLSILRQQIVNELFRRSNLHGLAGCEYEI